MSATLLAPTPLADHSPAALSMSTLAAAGRGDGLVLLLDEARRAVERDSTLARECLDRALLLLRREPTPAAGGLAKWQVSRVTAFIGENIGEPIRVTDLAAAAHLSAGHFSRLFRASFGEKPMAYVARKRIEHAQNLMTTTGSPLALLALDAGFCDQAHFTRVFKRTTGASPAAWLRSNAQGPARSAAA